MMAKIEKVQVKKWLKFSKIFFLKTIISHKEAWNFMPIVK